MEIEKLIERLKNAAGGLEGIKMCMDAADALTALLDENVRLRELMEQALIADVDPVRHGQWGDYELFPLTPSINGVPCSECGKHFSPLDVSIFNYCPNCGAKMDGGEENA